MKCYFALLSILILFTSCKKEVPVNNPSSEYFPNTTGNYWKYKVVDSILNSSSIVEVKIVGDKILPGGQNAKIWIYVYPGHIDTNYVFRVGDTIRFIDQGLSVRNTYIVPLQLNNKWRINPAYLYDSVKVIEKGTIVLNVQTFENSFLLQENGYLPNDYWNRYEWFYPNIGMITKTEKDLFTLGTNKSFYWELLEYDLK